MLHFSSDQRFPLKLIITIGFMFSPFLFFFLSLLNVVVADPCLLATRSECLRESLSQAQPQLLDSCCFAKPQDPGLEGCEVGFDRQQDPTKSAWCPVASDFERFSPFASPAHVRSAQRRDTSQYFFQPDGITTPNPGAFLSSGGCSNCLRGTRFLANVDMYVTELGHWNPNMAGYNGHVSLFRVSDMSLLATLPFGSGPNQWDYKPLSVPVHLVSGEEYIIADIWTSGGYFFGTGGAAQFRPSTGDWTYVRMQYCNSCTESTFPTLFLNGYTYGVATFSYVYSLITATE